MPEKSDGRGQHRLDSDDFTMGKFKAHGRSEIWTEGQIVYIQTKGPFNVEAVAAINAARADLLTRHPPTAAYAYINQWRISVMMSPDAMAEYANGLANAYTAQFRPPSAMAWIFPAGIEGASLMRPHFEKMFATVGIPFRIFADNESAETWVRHQLRP